MKKGKKRELGIIAVCAVIAMAFTFRSTQNTSVDIDVAIREGKITAGFIANGKYNGATVNLKIKNNRSEILRVKVPAGSTFKTAKEEEQELVTVEDQIIVLQPKAQNEQTIKAYCTEASDKAPGEGNSFTIAKTKNDNLYKLFTHLKTNKFSEESRQDAIWAITNKTSISNIDVRTPQDRELRKFLSGLLGAQDPWYSTPQNRVIQEDRQIVSETVVVKGDLSFTTNKGALVHQEITKKDGTLIHKSNKSNTIQTGNVDFSFTLKVKGWEKGEYAVRVMEGSRVLATYPFQI